MRLNQRRKSLLPVALVLLLLVLTTGYHIIRQADAPEPWPLLSDKPLIIPLQATIRALPGIGSPDTQAEESWRQALEDFQSASDNTAAVRTTAPKLEAIWSRWPDTALAPRARQFYINTLSTYDPAYVELHEHRLAYLDQALLYPELYFTQDNQATSQHIVLNTVESLVRSGKEAAAWELCLKLRWLVPRVDFFAPACEIPQPDIQIMVPMAGRIIETILSRVPGSVIEVDQASDALKRSTLRYIAQPYSSETMGKVIIELHKDGYGEAADQLLQEMLEIDPSRVPRIEVALEKFKKPRREG